MQDEEALTVRFSVDRGQTWSELPGVSQQFSQALERLGGAVGSIAAVSIGVSWDPVEQGGDRTVVSALPAADCQCAFCMAVRYSQRRAAESVSDEDAYQSLQSLLARCQPHEVAYVLDQLRRGRVNGNSGLTCFIGLVARCRGQIYTSVKLTDEHSIPFENWLRAIVFGATPANHPRARLLEQWLVAWLRERTIERFAAPVATHASARELPRERLLLAGEWEGGGPGG